MAALGDLGMRDREAGATRASDGKTSREVQDRRNGVRSVNLQTPARGVTGELLNPDFEAQILVK